jgi:hypothetical protein
MKHIFPFCLLFVMFSCQNTGTNTAAKTTQLPVAPLQAKGDSLKFPDGKVYQIIVEEDTSSEERGVLNCDSDAFEGRDRAEAKTSFVTSKAEVFNGIEALFGILPVDEWMEQKAGISRTGTKAARINVEQRAVQLGGVALYAIKREADGDFHLIIGNRKDNGVYINAEISGLPDANSPYYTRLAWVRQNAEKIFGELCSNGYYQFSPAIPTVLEGSLFFDIDHKDGAIGPKGKRPITAWEIHPITNIGF